MTGERERGWEGMTGASAGRRWTVAGAGRRGVEVLREQGPTGLLYGILAHLGYRRLWIFELELGHLPPERSLPERVEIGDLREDRPGEYLELRPDVRPDAGAKRLRAGHRCLLRLVEKLGYERIGTVHSLRLGMMRRRGSEW